MNVLVISLPFAVRPHPTDRNAVVVDLRTESGKDILRLPDVSVEVDGLSSTDFDEAKRAKICADAHVAAREVVVSAWVRSMISVRLAEDPTEAKSSSSKSASPRPMDPVI